MNDDGRTLRAIAWTEICPWLILGRTFRISIRGSAIFLAALGLLLTFLSWKLTGGFLGDEARLWGTPPAGEIPWLRLSAEAAPGNAWLPAVGTSAALGSPTWSLQNPLFGPWLSLSRPWTTFFSQGGVWSRLPALLLHGLLTLAIWAWVGGAICRMAAVQLATENRLPLSAAIVHAGRKWLAYFGAPLFALGGMIPIIVLLLLLGLLLRFEGGIFLAALLWPLALLGGFVMMLLAVGLLLGWPLMWGAVSVEEKDSYDAVSRSYSYVYQKPLRYLFYALVAALLGALGWWVVANFALGVVKLTYWAVAWGAGGPDRVAAVVTGEGLGSVGRAGATLIGVWVGVVKLLAVGFLFSYFWTAATAIYYLLRKDVDDAEMDEIQLDDETSRPHRAEPAAGQASPGELRLASDDKTGEPQL